MYRVKCFRICERAWFTLHLVRSVMRWCKSIFTLYKWQQYFSMAHPYRYRILTSPQLSSTQISIFFFLTTYYTTPSWRWKIALRSVASAWLLFFKGKASSITLAVCLFASSTKIAAIPAPRSIRAPALSDFPCCYRARKREKERNHRRRSHRYMLASRSSPRKEARPRRIGKKSRSGRLTTARRVLRQRPRACDVCSGPREKYTNVPSRDGCRVYVPATV